jgi:hypothetical protein
MIDVVKTIERLNEIRNLKKELEREEEGLRQALAALVGAAGGRLIVGSYVLTLTPARNLPVWQDCVIA